MSSEMKGRIRPGFIWGLQGLPIFGFLFFYRLNCLANHHFAIIGKSGIFRL